MLIHGGTITIGRVRTISVAGEYWISFYPGIALLITIVAINLVGDRLRDVLNPRTHK